MEGADWVKAVTCDAPFLWNAGTSPQGSGAPAGPTDFIVEPSRVSGSRRDHRRLRPRDEVEHPAALHQSRARRAGVSGDDAGRGRAGDQAGRDLLQQRPRRSGGARLRRAQRQGRRRIGRAGVRHLPRPPGAGHGAWAARPTSSSSATAAPTIRSSTSRPGKVEITSQNHGFAVDPASLPKDVEVTHLNLYDNTVEGLKHKRAAGLLRAVPPGGGAGAARRRLPVRDVPRFDRRKDNKCPSVPTSTASSSSARGRSSSARRASSTTRAPRPARRCAPKASRSSWSTATRRRS